VLFGFNQNCINIKPSFGITVSHYKSNCIVRYQAMETVKQYWVNKKTLLPAMETVKQYWVNKKTLLPIDLPHHT